MKGLILILLWISQSWAPNPGTGVVQPPPLPPTKPETPEKETPPVCDNSLSLEVLKASKGMLSMESALMVGKAGTDAVSSTEDGGGSASLAHKGSIAINSAMAVHALSAYDDCTSALNKCRTNCNPETEGIDPIEKKNKQAVLSECETHGASCEQALMQAGLSAMNAGISFMALKKLGGDTEKEKCKGDDCPDDDIAPLPDFIGPSLPTATTTAPDTSPGKDEKKTTKEFTPPEKPKEKKTTVAKKDKGEKYKTTKEGTGSDNTAGLSPSLNGQKNTSDSKPSGGLGGSDLGRGLSSASNNDGEGLIEDDDNENEAWRNNQGITGAFSGGLTTPSANNRGQAPGGPSQGGKKGKDNKKLAGAFKNQKGDLFSKTGVHSSIFEKMSQLIQSYCGESCKIEKEKSKQ